METTSAYVDCPKSPGVAVLANRVGRFQKSNDYRCTKCGNTGHRVLYLGK